jgi:hypothetical protein
MFSSSIGQAAWTRCLCRFYYRTECMLTVADVKVSAVCIVDVIEFSLLFNRITTVSC